MANFRPYNESGVEGYFDGKPLERYILRTWILGWTSKHDDGVAVFWHEERNELAVFSQCFPHRGWQEYTREKPTFANEHQPWEPPGDDWLFIGEL